MIGVEAERVEVEPLVLDLGPLGDLPAHADEDVCGFVLQLRQRVPGARAATHGGLGDVDGLRDEPRLGLCRGKFGLAALKRALEPAAGCSHELARCSLLILRDLAHQRVELRDG